MRIIFLVLTISVLALTSKTAFASNMLLNEIVANPLSGEKEWVEIYNSSSENIELNGWNLQERTASGTFNTYSLPNVILQTKALCFYEFSTAKLNNDSDTVNLLDDTGTLQDTYSYTSAAQGKSFARVPDGENWSTDIIPTKASICSSLPAPATPPVTPTPAPSPSSSQPTSLFTISGIPSQINSDQSFSVKITLSMPSSANTDYYLKGAFKKSDGTRYLGLTKKDSEWVEYGDDYSDQYKITTDSSGNWNGSIEVKPDTLDNDYKGSGDYIFKIGRFTSSGSGPTWSNDTTIKINDLNRSSLSDSSTPQPTSKATSSSSPSPTIFKSPTPKPSYQIASIAGIATAAESSPEPVLSVKGKKQTNPFLWVGLIFIFAGVGAVGYIYLRKNGKLPI
ncbi:MAG: lamin tail domain-containing protein [bacterium]|nr:lamin tail domain-containing protein [bacterium]